MWWEVDDHYLIKRFFKFSLKIGKIQLSQLVVVSSAVITSRIDYVHIACIQYKHFSLL